MSTRCDEQNCQVQCVGCNMFNHGEQFKFSLALDAKYGRRRAAEDLLCKATKTLKIMPHEYKEKISYYKSLVENLLKEKGLSLKK
jgi:hypothetical protein